MRVLIIDDDPLIRAGCRKVLERHGFACTAAQDGRRALEYVRRASFDAALLDLKMPDLSGMETLKKLRDESPNTAVIIITGYASIDSAVEAVKAGAFDYLPKPFTPEVLTARVRRAVRSVREALEASLIRFELERKKNGGPANVPPAVMGRVARLIHGSAENAPTRDDPAGADTSSESLARLEADAIRNALKQFRGNKTRAAERLGINRKTLR
ncbi:MAG: DNA-binding response regulator, partial [Acidobacteria bacterium]|nr:DNA-binding response regulator [Acidobacteriota bacterium]